MASLRVVFQQAQLFVADNPDAQLDPATLTAMKATLQGKYDTIAAQVKAEVAGW